MAGPTAALSGIVREVLLSDTVHPASLSGVVREVLLTDTVHPVALSGVAREVLLSDAVHPVALSGVVREVLVSVGSFPIGPAHLLPRRPPVPIEYLEDQSSWLVFRMRPFIAPYVSPILPAPLLAFLGISEHQEDQAAWLNRSRRTGYIPQPTSPTYRITASWQITEYQEDITYLRIPRVYYVPSVAVAHLQLFIMT